MRVSGHRVSRQRRAAWGAAVLVLLAIAPCGRADEAQRRFLLVYSGHNTLVANAETTAGVTAVFDAALKAGYEIYAEYRDGQRFPGPEADRVFREEMARKYRGQRFDAVLTFGRWALDYAVADLGDLGVAAPIVFGGVSGSSLDGVALPADVHGVLSSDAISGTVALARALQPKARRVVVMAGSAPFDRLWKQRVANDMAGVTDIEVDFVSGLTLDGFREVAGGLGSDTILLVLTIHEDAAGQQLTPLNAAQQIAEVSGAPTYSIYDTYIGRGIVGGDMQRFRDIGAEMGREALRLLGGRGDVPVLGEAPTTPIVDWRQLQRFGLDRDRLPPGTLVEFYEPPAWERYRWQILAIAAVMLAQSATIAALFVQDRRRRGAGPSRTSSTSP